MAHFVRSGFGALALFASFVAVARLNIAEALLIAQLTPVIMTVAAILLFSEKATIWRLCGLMLCFIGVVVLVWPELGTEEPDKARTMGLLIALAAAILSAIALLMVRRLNRTESPGAIALYFVIASMIGGLLFPALGLEHARWCTAKFAHRLWFVRRVYAHRNDTSISVC